MISEQDKTVIISLAKKYGVKAVLLFGSSAEPGSQARDIDLGVEGIAPERFFDFYGKLIRRLSKPVDVVDLSKDTKFNRLVYRDGIRLYG
jgi:predicted nucleotidyltransferase